jgi:2-polyprenyl-6-methoxyphenol hydroxylase-like FAD-dependent oxidoreductase
VRNPLLALYDSVIIGGGPAGLSAAIALAQHGLRILLCEQKPFPVDKACGEGIMPTGVAHLTQLGIAPYLTPADYHPFAGIRYISAGGKVATADFAQGPGWGIRRLTLSAALLQRAATFPNLEICAGQSAEPIERHQNGITVKIGRHSITTRLLIGADGLNSRVRRWAGLESRANWQFAPGRRPEHTPGQAGYKLAIPEWTNYQFALQRWGIRQHFHIPPWSNYVEVHWHNGIEAYVTPCGPQLVNIAFLWDRRRFQPAVAGKALFSSLLNSFISLHERLAEAIPADTPRAIGPLQRRVPSPAADGLLLIGDAAGYLDAITGEGISLATAQALALAEIVAPLLAQQTGLLTGRDLAPYAKAHNEIVRPYYQLTHLVLWISRHPAVREWVISTLAHDNRLFQHLLSANMGLASPWSPAVFGRFLLAATRR